MSHRLRMGVMSALFAALTCALSLVAVPLPFSPVPVTGQTFGVMLGGAILGPVWGAVSVLVYIALGCLGFPVFAGGRSGLPTLAGPTGGYLAGFVAGAAVTGLLAKALGGLSKGRGAARRRSTRADFWAYLASTLVGGVVVVHALGALWLAGLTGVGLEKAFMLGSAPFLFGDAFKAVAAALMAGRLRRGLTALLSSRRP